MIVVIPIAIGMPPAAVFVPPAMPLPPAAFPRFTQFVPCMFRLAAIPAVMFRRFVEPVVCLGDSALAVVIVMGIGPWGPRKGQQSKQRSRRQQGP